MGIISVDAGTTGEAGTPLVVVKGEVAAAVVVAPPVTAGTVLQGVVLAVVPGALLLGVIVVVSVARIEVMPGTAPVVLWTDGDVVTGATEEAIVVVCGCAGAPHAPAGNTAADTSKETTTSFRLFFIPPSPRILTHYYL
jgi:hypothetical protein